MRASQAGERSILQLRNSCVPALCGLAYTGFDSLHNPTLVSTCLIVLTFTDTVHAQDQSLEHDPCIGLNVCRTALWMSAG